MEVTQNSDTRLEKQRIATRHQPQFLSRHTDADKFICGRAGWKTRQQSGTGEGKGIFQRDSVVDDCCGAGHIYKFDAFVPPVQAGVAVSESTYNVLA